MVVQEVSRKKQRNYFCLIKLGLNRTAKNVIFQEKHGRPKTYRLKITENGAKNLSKKHGNVSRNGGKKKEKLLASVKLWQ